MAVSPYPYSSASASAAAVAEARRMAMLESALDAIVTIDVSGSIVEFNAVAERTFGHERGEVLGRPLSEVIVPPHLRAAHDRGFARHLATGESHILGRRLELSAVRRDGTEFAVELTITRSDVAGETLFTAYLRDLTEAHAAREALEHARAALAASERNLRTIVSAAPMVLSAIDADGVFTLCEGHGVNVLGLERAQLVGRSIFDVYADFPTVTDATRRALLGEAVASTLKIGEYEYEITHARIPGPVRQGDPVLVSVATDITERSRSEAQLAHDASHDRLTGLANRAHLEERLASAVVAAESTGGTLALLYLDLDGFKTVNDSLGHGIGDELLCALARRLETRVDGEFTLARHGGDEFMLLLDRLPGDGPRADRSPRSCSRRSSGRSIVDGAELQVGASIGIASTPATRPTPPTCSSTPTPRCTRPRRAARRPRALHRGEATPTTPARAHHAPALRAPARRVRAALPAHLRPARGAPAASRR